MARKDDSRNRAGREEGRRGRSPVRRAVPRRKRNSIRDFAVITAGITGFLMNINLGRQEEVSFGGLWEDPPLWLYRFLGGLAVFFAVFLVLYGAGTLGNRLLTRWRR